MLKQITLTNFKKHEALTVNFAPGLNAIKGLNESGKSTLMGSVAYALFGTKALPYSLEDTVTYGKPVNTLKVVLEFEVAGKVYTITRSKSAAELNYDGGTVTGQTETTNFIGKLLGTDAQAAPKLILANQNDIRGSLTAGPKATTELIEKLAQFDQLDTLVDLIQEKLTTGSTTAAEAALAAAQEQLNNLPDLTAPDNDTLTRNEREANDGALAAQAVAGTLQTTLRERTAELAQLHKANRDVERCEAEITAATRRMTAAERDLKGLGPLPAAPNAKAHIDALAKVKALEADLAGADQFATVEKFLGLTPAYVLSVTDLEAQVDKLRGMVADATAERAKCAKDIARDTALMVAGSCSLCGKDVSEVPEVVEKNAKLQGNIEFLTRTQGKLAAAAAKDNEEVARLLKIKSDARGALAAANKPGVVVKQDTVPPVLAWGGRTDFDKVEKDLIKARKVAKDLELKEREYAEAAGNFKAAQRAVDRAETDLLEARAALAGRTLQPTEGLEHAIQALESDIETARNTLDTWRTKLEAARSARREAVAAWENHLKIKAMLQAQVVQREDETKALRFNNTLLKAVRSARPVIADRLWGLVLGAVSKYFSDMRGQRSLVTKTPDGFVVDGHAAAGLSGSTLDVLGLAIRVALVRTFVPHASLLVLDEPAAGCDADRTQALLGFLSSSGFAQTVVVSHEEATEAVADHLIEL